MIEISCPKGSLKLADRLRMQAQRFEYKYVIPESVAMKVRRMVSLHLSLDPFGARQPEHAYPVHSLYFDSPDFRLFHSTINGDRNRFKLRVRFYDSQYSSVVYGEIKRRNDNTISKTRCALSREALARVCCGHVAQRPAEKNMGPEEREASEAFCFLIHSLRVQPVCHVAYLREAWVKATCNRVRVTFDRQVRSEPLSELRFETRMKDPVFAFGEEVILELKFTDRFPAWFQELIETYNLTQCGAAKYVDGLSLIRERKQSAAPSAKLFSMEKSSAIRTRRRLMAEPFQSKFQQS